MNIIKHSVGLWEIPEFITPGTCETLIARSEAEGFTSAKVRTETGEASIPQIRNNSKILVEWPEVVDELSSGVHSLGLPELGGRPVIGLPRHLRFYRYNPGERFKMHRDGPWVEDGLTSEWTLIVYLNEGFTGGRTIFRDRCEITPKTGSAIVFTHRLWHEGEAVETGTKYVLRSDVLYGN